MSQQEINTMSSYEPKDYKTTGQDVLSAWAVAIVSMIAVFLLLSL